MSQTASISRDSLMQLGRAGQPWQFHSVMRQIGDAADSDPAIVFLHAANLAKLGLKELAAKRFGQLPFQVRQLSEVSALWNAISALSASVLSQEQLLQNFDGNAAALIARDIASSSISVWRDSLLQQLNSHPVFRAVDRNIVIPGLLEDDFCSRSRELVNSPQDAADYAAALVIDGLSPPWLLADAVARWPKNNLNFWRRIIVVHENAASLALALACADLTTELAQSRTWLFLGEGATRRFAEYLKLHRDELLVSRLISLRESDIQRSDLADIINTASQAQADELKVLHDRVQVQYAPRDKNYWANRYKKALSGGGSGVEPLRVLVPTTRYSTVIQHSSRDIVDAFQALGHKAKLLIEPDDSCVLAANAYWRAYADFNPDLVLLINFPRALRETTTPANIPYVTWLQDAMPHLFDPEGGSKQGPLDFSCGYLFDECFRSCGWDRDQGIAIPILVNERKFHDSPVTDRPDLQCEVAFVSNHAETPDQMHARLTHKMNADSDLVAAISEVRDQIPQIISEGHRKSIWESVEQAVGAAARRASIPPQMATSLQHTYALPMAGQIFRHQALEWAAEICHRRNWRLHLYGRGWNTHPSLAANARGLLVHGDELRAAYQLAAVQLHLDSNTITHQRVLECLLSGGFVASRMTFDALRELMLWGFRMLATTPPDGDNGQFPILKVAKHPPLALIARIREELGVPPAYPDGWWPQIASVIPASERGAYLESRALDCTWIFDDLRTVTFRDAASLELLLERNILNPSARKAVAGAAAARIGQTLTYSTMCNRIVNFVSQRLAGQV